MSVYNLDPEECAWIVRQEHEKDIAKTYLQRSEYLKELESLPKDEKRIGGKWMNSYKLFMLTKKECNGFNKETYLTYDKPYTDTEISMAIRKVFPEVFQDFWVS